VFGAVEDATQSLQLGGELLLYLRNSPEFVGTSQPHVTVFLR
jgi:hypothetical protein